MLTDMVMQPNVDCNRQSNMVVLAQRFAEKHGYARDMTGTTIYNKMSTILPERTEGEHVLVEFCRSIHSKETFTDFLVRLYDDPQFGSIALEYVYDHIICIIIRYIDEHEGKEMNKLSKTNLLPFAFCLRLSCDGSRHYHISVETVPGAKDFAEKARLDVSTFPFTLEWPEIQNAFERCLLYHLSIV